MGNTAKGDEWERRLARPRETEWREAGVKGQLV